MNELTHAMLLKAIEDGLYNIKPGKLRSGEIMYIGDLDEHETDVLWMVTFGHIGHDTPGPKTPEQQAELDKAYKDWLDSKNKPDV